MLVLFLFSFFMAEDVPAQIPVLPQGAQTKWVVAGPEEIVSYLIFDPATVKDRIPRFLRLITIGELAEGNVSWAEEHLEKFPAHGAWGISFVEIVRMKTFAIDGHSPRWPENGAAAFWFARVAPADPADELGPGKPFLVLEFWLPDRKYVAFMRAKGHYARFGEVRLRRDSDGKWIGSIDADGLSATCACTPAGEVEGFGARGQQVIFPPAGSGMTGMVRIAFAGHREQECTEDAFWKFRGTHPLAKGIVLGTSSFQFGYDLMGGAYRR